MENAKPDTIGRNDAGGVTGAGGALRKDKPAPNGLHDKSYQEGGARGAEAGDGLTGDGCTGTDDIQDIGAGAD